ncbi:centromere-associated protein E-like [Penaeus chinensis]|uniref:centromere-associated protein E-like n=1 Tax=Penaeus chinensis TaxID=139456 RepID=UPI001FB7E4B4|nr:centromere-associated protein E-like [Penaeus chinensis]
MTDNNEIISSLKLEPELGGSDGGGCLSCSSLRKRLQTCREWVKFYHVKLEQQDKLLHIVADFEREKQQNMELQMAFDQRTREASFAREQMANLLMEIQPLREKISTLEKELDDEKKLKESAENQVIGLKHMKDQQRHQIDAMRAKVDMNLIEVLEKKLHTARSDIKLLRCSLDDKSREVSELKEFLQDRRDHFLRNQKKTAWSLRLAQQYGSRLADLGVHPDELTEEPSWTRLMSLLELIQSQLHSHYQVYRRKEIKTLKENLVAIALLPSQEEWLKDFDDDQASDYDSFEPKKIKKEQKLVDEAKKLEELLQMEEKSKEEAGQQRWNAEQNQADGDCSSGSDESCVEITPLVKEESDTNACEIKRQKKPVEDKAKDHNTRNDKSENHKRKGRNKNDDKKKSYCKGEEESHRKERLRTVSSDAGKIKKSDCQVNEAKPNEYFQPSVCVDRSVNVQSPSEDIQILKDKKVNEHTDRLAEPAKTEVRKDSQNDLMDFNDFPLHVQRMSEGDDPVMAILKDMKPHAKIDCLDDSFSFGESEMFPVEIQNENPIDFQNPHGLTRVHEDLELLSDSYDDTFDRPRKLLTQESQGFLIDSCEQSKSSLMSQEVFTENSPDDEVDVKPVESLMGRNFLSSQGFSFDMDEVSGNSEGKDDKENRETENCLEIEKVGSKTEKHSQTDTWDLNLSEDDEQCMSKYSEQNGQIDSGNTNTDTISKVENGEEFVAKKRSTLVDDCKESHKEGEELVEEDRNSELDEDGMHTHNSIATIDCGLRKSSIQETLIRRPCSRDASSNSIEANSLDIKLQEDILIQEPMKPSEKIMEHSLSNDQRSQQSLQEKSSVSAGCCVSEGENNSNGSLSKHPQQILDQNVSQESTKISLHEDGLCSNSIHSEDMKDMEESRCAKLRTSSESNSSDHSWLLSSESDDDKDLMHKKHVHPKILPRKSSTSIIAVEVNKTTKINSKTEERRNCEETQSQIDNGGDKEEETSQKLTAGVARDMELQEKINDHDSGSSGKHNIGFMAGRKVQLVNKDQLVQNDGSGSNDCSDLTCADMVGNRQLFSNSISAGQSTSSVSTLLEDCSSEKVSNMTEGINNMTDLKSLKTDLIQENSHNNPQKDDGVKSELNSADERRILRNSSSSNCSDSEGQFVECTSEITNQNGCIQKSSEDESELSSEPREEKSSAHCPVTNRIESDIEIVCSNSSKVCLSKNVRQSREPTNKQRSTVTRKTSLRNTKNDSTVTDSFNLEDTKCNTHPSGTKMTHQNVQLIKGNFLHSSTNDTYNTEMTLEKDKLCTKLEREKEATPHIIAQRNESEKIKISSELENFTVNKDIKINDNSENDNGNTKTIATSDASICSADTDTTTNVVSPINSLVENVAGTSDANAAINTKNMTRILDNETMNIEKQLEVEETMKQKLKAVDKEFNEESTLKTKDEIVTTKKPVDHIKEGRNLDTPKEMVDAGDTNQKSLPRNPQMAGVRFSWGKNMLQCQKMPSHSNNVEFILQKKITREIPNACDQLKANVFSLEIRNSRRRQVRPSMREMQSTCLGTGDRRDIDIKNKVQHNRKNTDMNGDKQGKNLLEERNKLPHKRTTERGSKEALSSLGNSAVMSTQEKSQRTEEPKKSVLKRLKASQSLFSSESSGAEEASAPCVRKRRIMKKKRNQKNKFDSDSEEAEITNEVSQKSSRKVSRFGRKSERDQGRKSTKSDNTESSVSSRTSPCVVKRLKRDSSSSSYGNIRTSVSESDVTSPKQLSVSCKDNGKDTLSHQSSAANKEELQIVKNDISSDSEALKDDEGHFKGEHRISTVVSSESDNTEIECKEGEQRKKKRAIEVEKSYKNEPHINTLGQVKKSLVNENFKKVTQPIQNSKKAKLEVSKCLQNISSQSQDVGIAETNSLDTGMKQKNLSVKKKNCPTTFEQAARIASTLKRHHSEIQEKKRTAILLDTTPQFGVKRSRKDHMLAKVSSEEDMQSKTQSEMVKKEQTVAYKSKVFCTSSSDDDSDTNKKNDSLVEKNKSKENQSLTQPSVSDSTMKATVTPHPGLVSSLAKLGTLDRPKTLPKAKTVPNTSVPASSDFIEKLFFIQRSQTNDRILQCQPKDTAVGGTQGREESNVECMPTSENQSTVQVPIIQDPCTSTQQQKAKKLVICDRQTKEELMTFGKTSINNVSDSKEPVTLTKENSALSTQLIEGVKHKEAQSQDCQENEKKEEAQKYDMAKNTSGPQHESYVKLLPSTKKSLSEEKENELRSIVEELATCNINGKDWKRLINKLKRLAVSAPASQIIRVFLWAILQQNPLQEKKVLQGLTPTLYQLFQALCVLEIQLGLSLRTALSNSIRALVCQPSSHLRPHSLGCLAAWYVANLSASNKEDKEILQLGRAFLVDLLFHHPGTVHLALYLALTSGQKFLIRMVNHREASGIEKVLQWVAFHGIWMGTESVRNLLIKYLTDRIGVHNPPANDLAVLVKDLLSKLGESTKIAISCNLLTGIMILARWQGKPWIQSHLLPAVTALISQESEGGKEEQVEEVPRQLFDILTDSLGKLNGIFSKDATSADNTKLGCELQELKSALTRLLHLAWGDMKMKPR